MSDANDSHVPVALVTGAGSGLGAATVGALVDGRYAVAALDIDQERLGGLAQDGILRLPCDLQDACQIDAAVRAAADHFGRLDLVVNCAGVDHTYWLEQLTLEQFDQILAINLRAPFVVAKAAWPHLKRHGNGQIIFIASTAATRVWTGASAYVASKHGVLGLARALNLEGRQDGIRVMTVIPGGMNTRFLDRLEAQGIGRPDPAFLQDPASVARTIVSVLGMPADSAVQEIVITHPNEPSWP